MLKAYEQIQNFQSHYGAIATQLIVVGIQVVS